MNKYLITPKRVEVSVFPHCVVEVEYSQLRYQTQHVNEH